MDLYNFVIVIALSSWFATVDAGLSLAAHLPKPKANRACVSESLWPMGVNPQPRAK